MQSAILYGLGENASSTAQQIPATCVSGKLQMGRFLVSCSMQLLRGRLARHDEGLGGRRHYIDYRITGRMPMKR